MSSRFPFQPQRFRETLKYEDHIHNQIEDCRQAFNEGDQSEIKNTVESLLLLITPNMVDSEFKEALAELDEKWKIGLAAKEKSWLSEVRHARGGCPDLIGKPSLNPGMDHWKRVFMIACGLFERKGLMLKQDQEDSV